VQNLCFRCVFWGKGVAKIASHQIHPFYSIRTKMLFGTVLDHFVNLPCVKSRKTCVSRSNALFRGTQVAKKVLYQMHPFYSLEPKIMFGSVLEHFRNLWNVKRCKTCVLGENAIIWTSLGPLPRWVPGPTTRWAPGTTRLVPRGT
jgi:hypothetical protein